MIRLINLSSLQVLSVVSICSKSVPKYKATGISTLFPQARVAKKCKHYRDQKLELTLSPQSGSMNSATSLSFVAKREQTCIGGRQNQSINEENSCLFMNSIL